MDEIFNFLSSSARLNKQKRPRPKQRSSQILERSHSNDDSNSHQEAERVSDDRSAVLTSRDRTGKRDLTDAKRDQVHREQVLAFRKSMGIRVAHHQHETDLPDPLASFKELLAPTWWTQQSGDGSDDNLKLFEQLRKVILVNIEQGRWKEPTPIQMQAIPCLLERRDLIGAACTGSGKSGAFILPALFLTSVSNELFYGGAGETNKQMKKNGPSRQGEIRALVLAPSMELAAQLHRECERLAMNLPGGRSCLLLSKSNAPNVIAGSVGGKRGLDILVATPLRLVDSIQKGLRLSAVRIIILDESDRLLDAEDGKSFSQNQNSDNGEEQVERHPTTAASGSAQSLSFLSQMDTILTEIPPTATRALFSATVTPTVRSLAESILRSPIDLTIRTSTAPGGANPDIQQTLMFVGREEGKLLAIRQLVQRGELRPPVIVFLQSKERAQALFSELLYDGIHVDVIHAGRSKSARDNAVAKFRRGETWVLIASDLVARGVDFRAVNMVINYDLPESGITYIHRIGRCGRAGRKGDAITLFTESDFPNLRTIANVMKQSGCPVEDWMLQLPSQRRSQTKRPRQGVDTTPSYDKEKRRKKRDIIEHSKKKGSKKEA
jgi:ATP-dependent RNA helicase DDX52/ROK1